MTADVVGLGVELHRKIWVERNGGPDWVSEQIQGTLAEAYKLGRASLVGCGVAVMIWRPVLGGDRELLMHKRKGAHGEGSWSLVGGWMEPGESFEVAAWREVKEETGLELTGPCRVVDTMSTVFPEGKHSVTILMEASTWEGEPQAMEPDKIEGEWTWFRPGSLPRPLFLPLTQSAVMARIVVGQTRDSLAP